MKKTINSFFCFLIFCIFTGCEKNNNNLTEKNNNISEKNEYQIRAEKLANLDIDKMWEDALQNYEPNDLANPLFIRFGDDIHPQWDIQEYKPISDHYKTLSVKDFNKDWKYLCVFSFDNVSEEWKKSREKENFCIEKDDFKIIIGLFQRVNDSIGAFVAKITLDDKKVIEIGIVKENYNKEVALFKKEDYFWVNIIGGVSATCRYENISNTHAVVGGR